MPKGHRPDGSGALAFDDMVDACIQAGELVNARGTPELQAAMQVFLVLLGREVARRQWLQDGGGRNGY